MLFVIFQKYILIPMRERPFLHQIRIRVKSKSSFDYSKMSESNLKPKDCLSQARSNMKKPPSSAMLLFSAKKINKSYLLPTTEQVLAEDSDESNSSLSENKENVRKKINFLQLENSGNDSSFLCEQSAMRRSFHDSGHTSNQLVRKQHHKSCKSDENTTPIFRKTFSLHPGENENSNNITPTKADMDYPPKQSNDSNETYDSSFIDDRKSSTCSDQSSESSGEKENDIFLDGDILTPPITNIPKSERKAQTKSKFVNYRKCVTEKKQKHTSLKGRSQIQKECADRKLQRKRIIIPSDSSDDNEGKEILAGMSTSNQLTPVMSKKESNNNSDESSDEYDIEKIKASVRQPFRSKETNIVLDQTSEAIDNELEKDVTNYDDSFIDDSEGEESCLSSSQSYSDSDDLSSEDLDEGEAENSLICDVDGGSDSEDGDFNSVLKEPDDIKRKESTTNELNRPELISSNDEDNSLELDEGVPERIGIPKTKLKKLIYKKASSTNTKTFLCSLSMENSDDERQCHPEAIKYIKQYSRHKKELAKR